MVVPLVPMLMRMPMRVGTPAGVGRHAALRVPVFVGLRLRGGMLVLVRMFVVVCVPTAIAGVLFALKVASSL